VVGAQRGAPLQQFEVDPHDARLLRRRRADGLAQLAAVAVQPAIGRERLADRWRGPDLQAGSLRAQPGIAAQVVQVPVGVQNRTHLATGRGERHLGVGAVAAAVDQQPARVALQQQAVAVRLAAGLEAAGDEDDARRQRLLSLPGTERERERKEDGSHEPMLTDTGLAAGRHACLRL
jgi:hypothetical protein